MKLATADDVLAAYAAWNRHPSHEGAARRKEQAMAGFTAKPARLHRRIEELRRQGMKLVLAVRQACSEETT